MKLKIINDGKEKAQSFEAELELNSESTYLGSFTASLTGYGENEHSCKINLSQQVDDLIKVLTDFNKQTMGKDKTSKEPDNSAFSQTDVIQPLPTREYNIDFNRNVMCRIKVQSGNIKITGAINGWGNVIEKETIIITEVGHVV